MKDEYSPYKIVHHPSKLHELWSGQQPVPLQVQMVLSNACNQRCSFCAYRMKDFLSNETFDETQMLKYDKVIETLACFKKMGVGAVQYTGGGEPLVFPDHNKIFESTLNYGLDLALVTNGMALTETTCNLLGDASWVRVSVDAAEANTYSLIRNVKSDAFKKVVDNIKMLIKHQRKSIIGVGFVVEKENYTEIFNAAKLFKSIGVNNFRISGAFTNAGYSYFRDFKEYATHLSKKAEELSDNYFTVFNLFNDRLADTFVGEQNYRFCPMKELQVYIGADHNVYTCCTLAYNKKGLIGSIKNQSFTDLWRSDKKRLFYKRHNAKKICKHPCMYRGKNEFINYCINEDAKHTNFI